MDEKYLASRVATANEAGLVALLYEGLIDTLKDAQKHLQERRIKEFAAKVDKAKNILAEFVSTLKGDSELANQLRSLYLYVNQRMTEGYLKKDSEKLEEAIKVLMPLYEGWKALEQQEFQENIGNRNRPEIIAGATYGRGQLKDYVINHTDKWGRG
ncbi:flagellar export chaperone FliS [Clostridiaceae bacterium 35-E11]